MIKKNLKEINLQIFDSIKNNITLPSFDKQIVDDYNSLKQIIQSNFFSIFNGKLKNLNDFLINIDQNHGEIPFFIHNQFQKDFLKTLCELNKLYNFCKDNSFSVVDDFVVFEKSVCKYANEYFLNHVGNPEKTKIHTRFLPYEKKWKARKSKLKQSVAKRMIQEIAIIDSCGIEMFYHNSQMYKTLLEILEDKKNMLSSIGCVNLASEIDSAIISLNDFMLFEKYGFQRITISKLLRFLAKDYEFISASIQPIHSEIDLIHTDAYKILDYCENIHINNQACSIFDHYAKIVLEGTNVSVLIGEIDTRSYFISYVCEE